MFDPYKAWAAMIEILEDRYDAKIDWKLIRKEDGAIVKGPQQPQQLPT